MSFARDGDTSKLEHLASSKLTPPFVTSYRDGHSPMPHNTATLFSVGRKSEPYFKRKLFGSESGMHSPGTKAVATPFLGTKVGLNICFDSCYPSIIRDTVRAGAEIIALPTIDPDSPFGFFAANHAAFTPIRAAEEGVSIVRADGYAFSTIADPDGQVLAQLPEIAEAEAHAAVPLKGHWTVYRWAGDWFLYACGLGLCGAAARSRGASEPGSRGTREPGKLGSRGFTEFWGMDYRFPESLKPWLPESVSPWLKGYVWKLLRRWR
jgi:hypothetical protein